MTRKQTIVIAASLLAMVLATGWFASSNVAGRKGKQVHPVDFASVTTSTAIPKSALHWSQGDQATWDIDVRSDAGGNETEVTLKGKIQACVLSTDEEKVRLAMVMPQAHFQYAGKHDEAMSQLFRTAPVLVTMQLNGDNADVTYPSHLAQEDLAMIRNAYSWFFVVQQANEYQIEEHTAATNWSFAAKYTWTPQGLKKQRHILDNSKPELPQVTVLESLHLGRVGHLWMSEVSLKERFQITLGSSTLATLQTQLHLKETKNSELCPELTNLASLSEKDALAFLKNEKTRPAVFKRLQETEQQRLFTGKPVAPLLADIKMLASRPYEESADAVEQLSLWLKANPQALGEFLIHLQASKDTEETALLIHALQTSSPELANQGLSAILANPASTELLEQALIETGSLRSNASQDLITQVWGIYEKAVTSGQQSLADTAAFNLGRIARETPAVGEWLTHQFLPDLLPTADVGDQIAALHILNNAKAYTDSVNQRAYELASASNAEVRAAALDFTGNLPVTTTHDALLLQSLTDSEKLVQVTAASVLSDPERPQSSAVQEALAEYQKRKPIMVQTE